MNLSSLLNHEDNSKLSSNNFVIHKNTNPNLNPNPNYYNQNSKTAFNPNPNHNLPFIPQIPIQMQPYDDLSVRSSTRYPSSGLYSPYPEAISPRSHNYIHPNPNYMPAYISPRSNYDPPYNHNHSPNLYQDSSASYQMANPIYTPCIRRNTNSNPIPIQPRSNLGLASAKISNRSMNVSSARKTAPILSPPSNDIPIEISMYPNKFLNKFDIVQIVEVGNNQQSNQKIDLWFVGNQLAHYLHKENYNLFRSLSRKNIIMRRANKREFVYLMENEVVKNTVRCVTLVEFKAAVCDYIVAQAQKLRPSQKRSSSSAPSTANQSPSHLLSSDSSPSSDSEPEQSLSLKASPFSSAITASSARSVAVKLEDESPSTPHERMEVEEEEEEDTSNHHPQPLEEDEEDMGYSSPSPARASPVMKKYGRLRQSVEAIMVQSARGKVNPFQRGGVVRRSTNSSTTESKKRLGSSSSSSSLSSSSLSSSSGAKLDFNSRKANSIHEMISAPQPLGSSGVFNSANLRSVHPLGLSAPQPSTSPIPQPQQQQQITYDLNNGQNSRVLSYETHTWKLNSSSPTILYLH